MVEVDDAASDSPGVDLAADPTVAALDSEACGHRASEAVDCVIGWTTDCEGGW
jgi:hypothetical protein